MGWYCYLLYKLSFPFTATCMAERATSLWFLKGVLPESAAGDRLFPTELSASQTREYIKRRYKG
ncbi:MAG: hypothetical protein KGZ93_05635 [Actinobacteria bacterium]|nr:hypothetical protein [Actinomycetota bacterium]